MKRFQMIDLLWVKTGTAAESSSNPNPNSWDSPSLTPFKRRLHNKKCKVAQIQYRKKDEKNLKTRLQIRPEDK